MDVPPPHWRTWWFALCILVVVLGIVLLWRSYEYRIIKIKKDHDLQISNLDVHAYRAQMNPQFILMPSMACKRQCYFVERTSSINILPLSPKLICNNFEMSNLDRLSLIDELDYIENYIALQALRLEKAIHTMITIDDTTRL